MTIAPSTIRRRLRRAATRVAGRRAAENALERRLVWILGSPRSGSSWLLQLLADQPRVIPINEPLIGLHLAPFAPNLIGLRATHFSPRQVLFNTLRRDTPNYFFSQRYEETWRPLTRRLILGRLRAEADAEARERAIADPILTIKEPNGSQAADIIMSLLPRVRLLFLLRDGRDVVDSELDALQRGSWLEELGGDLGDPTRDRLALIRHQAYTWVFRTERVQRAYELHSPEDRLLLRYEDLLANTLGSMRTLSRWAGLDADEKALRESIDRHSFASLPSDTKGSGKFTRAASPGLWRENFSAQEQAVLHEVMGEKLRELRYL